MARDQAAKPATPDSTTNPAAAPTSKAASSVKPATPDWERIELDYRAGIKSLREMADGAGVSHVTISKRAKTHGWVRNLAAKIQAKADDLVNKATVNRTVNAVNPVTERETVDANAQAVANVKLAHRTDIQRTRKITMQLLTELEEQASLEIVQALESVAFGLKATDMDADDLAEVRDVLEDIFSKVRSLPTKAKVLKDLGESLRVLVALERQAFGLDDKDNALVDPLTTLLHTIAKNGGNGFKPVAQDPEHEDEAQP